MDGILTMSNLKKAGLLGGAAWLTMNFTASQSNLIKGAALVAVLAVALPFASKL